MAGNKDFQSRISRVVALGAASLLLCGAVTANATNHTIPAGTENYECSVPTEFTVTSSVLGQDLVVTVPDTLVLNHDDEASYFINQDGVVNVAGAVDLSQQVEIGIPAKVSFANAALNTVKVEGTSSYGNVLSETKTQKEVWNAKEVTDAGEAGIDKSFFVQVNDSAIKYAGDYEGIISFTVNTVPVPAPTPTA